MGNGKYDVIVIGAGPAGLMFSRVVASKGFNVVILEKEGVLGTKPCGEGVSLKTLETAGISQREASAFVSKEVRRAHVYAPDGTKITIEEGGKGYILDKRKFLRVMANKAVDLGADILPLTPVKDIVKIDDGFLVKARGFEGTARLLVGADGYLSLVSRKLGFEAIGGREVIPTAQYLMANVDLEDPEGTGFYLGNEVAPGGYAWVFPKEDGMANVGIGVRGASPMTYLEKFIKEHPRMLSKAKPIEFGAAAVTIGGMLKKVVSDNVLLIGEAAGQVIPLTGGGIHSSIAGGLIAAEVSIEALEEEDLSLTFLKKYIEEYNSYWGKRIRDSKRALEIIEKLSDKELNELARILDPKDILDLANGENIVRVAAKLMRHPVFSVKIAARLMS